MDFEQTEEEQYEADVFDVVYDNGDAYEDDYDDSECDCDFCNPPEDVVSEEELYESPCDCPLCNPPEDEHIEDGYLEDDAEERYPWA